MVTYSTVNKFGEFERDKFISQTELFFDKAKVIRENNYDAPGVISRVSKYVYDENSELDSISIYNLSGELRYKLNVRRNLNEGGLDHKRELYDSSGEMRLYYDYYLSEGDSFSEKFIVHQKRGDEFIKISQSEVGFNQFNQALSDERIEFNSQGEVESTIRMIHTYEDYTPIASITYSISKDGEKVVSEVNREYTSKDQHGNPLIILKSTIKGGKKTTEMIELVYEYI